MATPAFREFFKKSAGAKIGIAVQSGPWSSGQVHRCPYFDQVFFIHNPFFSRDYSEGMRIVEQQVSAIQEFSSFDRIVYMWLYRSGTVGDQHKVDLFAELLDVEVSDSSLEVYFDESSDERSEELKRELDLDGADYAFIHTQSSDIVKNSAASLIRKAAVSAFGSKIFEVGRGYKTHAIDISSAFELMRGASYVGLVDSVFVHAADAMGKTIDVHATSPTIETANRPLHIERRQIVHIAPSKTRSFAARALVKLGPSRFTIPRAVLRIVRAMTSGRTHVDATGVTELVAAVSKIEADRVVLRDWCLIQDKQNILIAPTLFEIVKKSISWELESIEVIAPVMEKTMSSWRGDAVNAEVIEELAAGTSKSETATPFLPVAFYSNSSRPKLKRLEFDHPQSYASHTDIYKDSDSATKILRREISDVLSRITS